MELDDELEALQSFLQGEDAEIYADKSRLAEHQEATVQLLLAIGGVRRYFHLARWIDVLYGARPASCVNALR